MAKNQHPPLFSLVFQLWPLLFVPLTLYAVKTFGHAAGNLVLGVLFFYLFVFRADTRTRRLMIVLAVISGVFETANVASGAYKYFGILGSPTWIALGWAILGWWFVSLEPFLRRFEFRPVFALTAVVIVAASALNQTLSLNTAIALAGLYALSLCVSQPFGLYAFASFFALVAEYSGTASGVWGYFDLAGRGYVVPPDLSSLALIYPIVLAFCIWISGFENTPT